MKQIVLGKPVTRNGHWMWFLSRSTWIIIQVERSIWVLGWSLYPPLFEGMAHLPVLYWSPCKKKTKNTKIQWSITYALVPLIFLLKFPMYFNMKSGLKWFCIRRFSWPSMNKGLVRTGATGAWSPWNFKFLLSGNQEILRDFYQRVAWHP